MRTKKPGFERQESWRYKRLKPNWRRPKGIDNKMRRKIKGWPATVNVGYRGPKVVRGLHPSGYKEVLIHNLMGLRDIDHRTQAIKIAHTVGRRKRADILVEARRRKITILNYREITKKESEPVEKEEKKQKAENEVVKESKAEKKKISKRKRRTKKK